MGGTHLLYRVTGKAVIEIPGIGTITRGLKLEMPRSTDCTVTVQDAAHVHMEDMGWELAYAEVTRLGLEESKTSNQHPFNIRADYFKATKLTVLVESIRLISQAAHPAWRETDSSHARLPEPADA